MATHPSADSTAPASATAPRAGLAPWLTSAGSAVALLASGISLWETVLKQPSLKVHVGESMFYTRDPWGSAEVFVVPVTIVNSGAQDGAVIGLRLRLKNIESGHDDAFDATYTADASWFAGSDNVTNRTKRPKAPFSALPIAGRSAWSGTVLFYAADAADKRVATPRSQLTGELTVAVARPDGWLDRLAGGVPAPIAIAMTVPNFLPGALLSGDVARLKVAFGGAPPPPLPPLPAPRQSAPQPRPE